MQPADLECDSGKLESAALNFTHELLSGVAQTIDPRRWAIREESRDLPQDGFARTDVASPPKDAGSLVPLGCNRREQKAADFLRVSKFRYLVPIGVEAAILLLQTLSSPQSHALSIAVLIRGRATCEKRAHPTPGLAQSDLRHSAGGITNSGPAR